MVRPSRTCAALWTGCARSLTDEHLEAYKRAKLAGIDVGGGEAAVRRLSASTVNKRLDLRAGSSTTRSAAVSWTAPIRFARWCVH
jgi:hypothetical protein